MARPIHRAALLLLLTLACGDAKKGAQTVSGKAYDAAPGGVGSYDAAAQADDALGVPGRAAAEVAVTSFARALLDSPTGAIQTHLRIPDGLSEQQLTFFYKELRKKHLSDKGVTAVLKADFGPLRERFGDHASKVAAQFGVALEQAWAFGDTGHAAVLYWDGTRFWVVGVHNLL